MVGVALAVAAFVLMEPVSYAVHRWVMHGTAMRLHRSHHRRTHDGYEANDLFPVAFAALVGIGLFVGFNVPGFGALVPIGIGITAYGAAYALVHDLYIHRRFGAALGRRPLLDRLDDAHRQHHRFGGEPYGMLLPLRVQRGPPGPARQRPRTAAPPRPRGAAAPGAGPGARLQRGGEPLPPPAP